MFTFLNIECAILETERGERMRYFIGKVKLEHKIESHTDKGTAACDQLAAKSLAYIL